MEPPSTAAIGVLSFPSAETSFRSPRHAEVQDEVIAFFDQYRGPVLRYVLSFGTSMHDGEEIVQEVFLALFQHLRLQKSRSNLRGWIFRVAHNLALKKRTANHHSPETTASHEQLAEQHPDPSPNPEDQAYFAQRHRRLLAVFDALPELDQNCLRLRAEGLRYREIAEVLGTSLGNVSLLLTRSLARLARADRG